MPTRNHSATMRATRVRSEGFPTSATIILGDLLGVHAHMSWHADHAIVEAQYTHGMLEMSAPALLELVHKGEAALRNPVPGGSRKQLLADYSGEE